MNRRRVVLIASVTLLVLLVVVGAPLALVKRWDANYPARAYAKIELGMTEAEVNAVMGTPPGDFCTKTPSPFMLGGPFGFCEHEAGVGYAGPPPPGATTQRWLCNDWWITVTFDGDHRAIGSTLAHVEGWPEQRMQLFDRLRIWVGL